MDDHKGEPTGQWLSAEQVAQCEELERKLEVLQREAAATPLGDPPRKIIDIGGGLEEVEPRVPIDPVPIGSEFDALAVALKVKQQQIRADAAVIADLGADLGADLPNDLHIEADGLCEACGCGTLAGRCFVCEPLVSPLGNAAPDEGDPRLGPILVGPFEITSKNLGEFTPVIVQVRDAESGREGCVDVVVKQGDEVLEINRDLSEDMEPESAVPADPLFPGDEALTIDQVVERMNARNDGMSYRAVDDHTIASDMDTFGCDGSLPAEDLPSGPDEEPPAVLAYAAPLVELDEQSLKVGRADERYDILNWLRSIDAVSFSGRRTVSTVSVEEFVAGLAEAIRMGTHRGGGADDNIPRGAELELLHGLALSDHRGDALNAAWDYIEAKGWNIAPDKEQDDWGLLGVVKRIYGDDE